MTRISAMMVLRPVPDELAHAAARMADALQVLVLSVEICQRDLDPRWNPKPNLQVVNSRLLAIAREMRVVLQLLGHPEGGEADQSTI